MLGLFMLIPVLALHVDTLAHASPTLIGLSLGIYGVVQAACQIPLGAWSDRIGRKPVITLGLGLFAAGACLAAAGHSVWFVLAGRALQGVGAVSGATMALAADLSRERQRTKIMAVIGVAIGLAFSAAFVIGPIVNAKLGLSGLFYLTAALSLVAIAVLWAVVPSEVSAEHTDVHSDVAPAANPPGEPAQGIGVIYGSSFVLHLILSASFVAIPVLMQSGAGIAAEQHARLYLIAIISSFVLVTPVFIWSAKMHMARASILFSITLVGSAQLLLWLNPPTFGGLICALTGFFLGFHYLEASLPGMASRLAAAGRRGSTLGAFSTFQFLGMFAGGLLGGTAAEFAGYAAVPALLALVSAFWLLVMWRHRRLIASESSRRAA